MPEASPLGDQGHIKRPMAFAIEPYDTDFGQMTILAERDTVMEQPVGAT
jgi:hypothetical protein